MYTDKPSLLMLIELMRAHGVTQVVLCPGSRNIPIVKSLAHHPDFETYPVTDERSGAYFALGLIEATGRPAAVCCTSGSALANFFPAVTEACYQALPLLVLSGDRPQAWIDQMDGQTIPQDGIFGRCVKKSVQLPEGKDKVECWHANRLINEALMALTANTPGPVHINCPITEPFFALPMEAVPETRVIRRYTMKDVPALALQFNQSSTRLGIVGQSRPGIVLPLGESILWSSERLGNIQEGLHRLDMMLVGMSEEAKAQSSPELLITLGGHIVSKRTKQWLRQCPPKMHWHIAPGGAVVDLFQTVTHIIDADPVDFLTALTKAVTPSATQKAYRDVWMAREAGLPWPTFDYSAMRAVVDVVKNLPPHSSLHLANSSSVRYGELGPMPRDVPVWCNRGTSGIEGSMSTFVGHAVKASRTDPESLHYLVIGDLSFFYDMNALWNTALPANVRILVLNNQGGEIFHMLPGLTLEASGRKFVTADHKASVKGWALDRGFAYRGATDMTSLEEAVAFLMEPCVGRAPRLVEVMTSPEEDKRLMHAYLQSLKE